jgi:hypothetical protein
MLCRWSILAWFLVAVWVVWPSPSLAHELGASRGDYVVTDAGVDVRLNLSPREGSMAAGVPGTGVDLPNEAQRRQIFSLITLSRGGVVCPHAPETSFAIEDNDWSLTTRYPHCGTEGPYVVDLTALLKAVRIGHTHAAFLEDAAGKRDDTLHAGRPKLELAAPATASAPEASAPTIRSRGDVALEYLKIGVEHILFGFDHLVFLFGLVIIGGKLRHLLATITAFTVAHSITLGLAVTGVYQPPGSVIEPLIALSIAYVGVENFLVKDGEKRWRITAAFGLVHGFGFAGALGDVGVPADHLALGLLTFNVGVELGQLLVMAVLLPLVLFVGKQSWWRPRGLQLVSAAVLLLGLFWFVTRVLPES